MSPDTTATEAEIRADERAKTADAIAHELAIKVCDPMCEHPTCSTYRFAARTARQHSTPRPRIPAQGGAPE